MTGLLNIIVWYKITLFVISWNSWCPRFKLPSFTTYPQTTSSIWPMVLVPTCSLHLDFCLYSFPLFFLTVCKMHGYINPLASSLHWLVRELWETKVTIVTVGLRATVTLIFQEHCALRPSLVPYVRLGSRSMFLCARSVMQLMWQRAETAAMPLRLRALSCITTL